MWLEVGRAIKTSKAQNYKELRKVEQHNLIDTYRTLHSTKAENILFKCFWNIYWDRSYAGP